MLDVLLITTIVIPVLPLLEGVQGGTVQPGFSTRGFGRPVPGLPFFYMPFPFLLMPVVTIFRSILSGLVSTLCFLVYWTVTEGLWGQSLGKRVFGIRIVDLKGNRVGFGKALVESLGKSLFLGLDLIIGLLIPEAREKGQRVTNYLAGTVVVRSRPPRMLEVEG
jgi:uncharacterized RDD family membrane protein YckC